MGDKLTKSQTAALEKMGRSLSGVSLFDGRNRRALHRLQALGLAEFEDARDTGWKMLVRWKITPAGRAALAPSVSPSQAGGEG